MITLYAPDAQDWSNNGLCVLLPTECVVEEVAGGLYDLQITHPITDDLRWSMIQRGCLIKAPVPARDTPLIQQSAQAQPGQAAHKVYEVYGTGGYTTLYSQASSGYSAWRSDVLYHLNDKVSHAGQNYRCLAAIAVGLPSPPTSAAWVKIATGSKSLMRLKDGDEVIYHKASGSYAQVTARNGTTGYISSSRVRFLRDEPYLSDQPAYTTASPPRQIRDQIFRVQEVEVDDKEHVVRARARHISYDQRGNLIKTYNPGGAALQGALISMSANLTNEHDFNYYTNITKPITAEWALRNAVEAIQDPDVGAVPLMDAQLVRDNYDIFLLENKEIDRGVSIIYGKNLLGITSEASDDNVVTRIVPVGKDANGKPMLLPEVYLDSQHIGDYPVVGAAKLDVSDAAVKEATEDDPGMTTEQAYTKMREAVQAEFEKGVDLPDIKIELDFVHLGDTAEYAQYKDLQQVFLYDTVTIKHGPLGMDYRTQVAGYKYDAVLERYAGITLGTINAGAELGGVAGFQLPSGGISGQKIMPGAVGAGHLRELSVLAAHIGSAQITSAHIGSAQIINAHIQDATIEKAKIKDFVTEVASIAVAKIDEAWINEVWVDALNAHVVGAVMANIETLITTNAEINWAQIVNLTAHVANVAVGKIEQAIIGTAQIADAAIIRAKIGNAAIGSAQIEDGTITRANISAAAIESLEATMIAAFQARIQYLVANDLITDELYAALAEIASATIDVADINWLRVKDVVTGRAIFTEGTGGKFFIADLAVTEANMVSLTVGELIIKGEDGRFYALSVDEDGQPVTTLKQVGNEDVANNAINGATKILEGSVTADRLNATDIFVQNAVIQTLMAENIDVDTLFARDATLYQIKTLDIASINDSIRVKVEQVDSIQADLEGQGALIASQASEIYLLRDSVTTKVSQAAYDTAMADKADKALVSTVESSLRQDISGWHARIIQTENDITKIELGVDVTAEGVTIRQPSQTDTKLTLASDSITFSVPGKEALVISPDASYMPNLRLDQMTIGNMITTVSGTGANCRIVDQYIE